MYSTIEFVREISGFSDDTKVTDSIVKRKIQVADSVVDGALSFRYVVPLKYYVQRTITFSGTGTGTGTMSVTIGGITYSVAIELGTTAKQAADILRVAIITQDLIRVDATGSGAIVEIVSKTDSTSLSTAQAEIAMTTVSTTQGVSAVVDVIATRYPPLVQQISAEYAAMLLISDNYSPVGEKDKGSTRDWTERKKQLNDVLNQLRGGDSTLPAINIMDEYTKESIATTYTSSCESLPTDGTVPTSYITIDKVF